MPKRRLKTQSDVRRFLAHLIIETEKGKIIPDLASKLGYLSNILLRAIEGTELESRLDEIEKRLANK